MVAVRYAAGFVAVVCWVVTFVTCTVSGVTVLGTLLLAVWLWTFGVFTWAFWFASPEESAVLAAVDEDLAVLDSQGDPRR